MNVQQKQQKGFTIIEVILVLAIAGLIFLMVFLALPALQRGQRDTQRKNDLSRFASSIQNYQSANQGAVPAANEKKVGSFVSGYLTKGGDTFNDPHTGTGYTFTYGVGAAPTTEGQIRYATNAQCDGTDVKAATSGGNNKFAASVFLEGGAGYCVDNH